MPYLKTEHPKRECVNCGASFVPTRSDQIRCRKNCERTTQNIVRTQKRAINELEFIAVDGEGVDRPDGKHEYVMLSIGAETLTNPNGSELHYDQIFTFMWEQFLLHPQAAFVGFSLGYDFTQWTKHLTEHEAFMLYHRQGIATRKKTRSPNPEPFPVYVNGNWEIDILAGKRFKLSKHIHRGPNGTEPGKNYDTCRCGSRLPYPDWGTLCAVGTEDVTWAYFEKKAHGTSRMFVCDTFPFHQAPFLSVIDPSKWEGVEPVASDEEYALISEGKSKRSSYRNITYGAVWYLDEMARYNRAENAVLSNVCDRLNRGLMSINLKLDRENWYGPGRAAQVWMNQLHPKSMVGPKSGRSLSPISREYHEETLERWQLDIGRLSYYGGWFEQFIHGHIPGTVWEYDINSAYPAVIASLPCLLHGRWTRGKGNPPDNDRAIICCLGTFVGSNRFIGGLPHRTSKGAIVHPHTTSGWYWKHEVAAATRAGLIDTCDIKEWVCYEPCDCLPPFGEISALYDTRIQVGKNTPDGKSLKLVYNSSYGKCAQSIGNPRYANGIYASLITAGCRTQILDAIATHPDGPAAVTMIATDGLYFRTRHPTLDLTPNKLGCWEEKKMTGMCQLMPGIYWDDTARRNVREGKRVKVKSRGISPADLAVSMTDLDAKFTAFAEQLQRGVMPDEWPMQGVKVEFAMVTAKQAVLRNDWSLAGHVTHGDTRYLKSIPVNKRDWSRPRYVGDVVRTPIRVLDDPNTVPYDRQFGLRAEADILRETLGWGTTPEGDVAENIWDYFNG